MLHSRYNITHSAPSYLAPVFQFTMFSSAAVRYLFPVKPSGLAVFLPFLPGTVTSPENTLYPLQDKRSGFPERPSGEAEPPSAGAELPSGLAEQATAQPDALSALAEPVAARGEKFSMLGGYITGQHVCFSGQAETFSAGQETLYGINERPTPADEHPAEPGAGFAAEHERLFLQFLSINLKKQYT